MIQIGNLNTLKIVKFVDFGAYLDAGNGNEILLPKRYVTAEMEVGGEVEVFIYNDSEDRPVATTETPKAFVNQCAFLKVTAVNNIGAFLDWGLQKDLLVPFREQKVRMVKGRYYTVFVYLDDNSKRIVASAKLDKFLDNVIPKYSIGDKVNILINKKTDLGYKVVVDNLFWGMIYHNEIFSDINIGETHEAFVKQIRPDGKIDLSLSGKTKERMTSVADEILSLLKENASGEIPYNDGTPADTVKSVFACSKRDFKKAIGNLYKKHLIEITDTGLRHNHKKNSNG